MKFIYKAFLGLGLIGIMASCTDEDTFPYDQDEILATQSETGFVRLTEVISGEVDLFNIPTAEVSFSLEAWTEDDANSLDRVEIFVSYIDNTPDNGDASAGPVAVATYPASAWTREGDDNLPNITITHDVSELLTLLGIDETQMDGGDSFEMTMEMVLTNGNRFTRDNASGSLPGWPFYNAPFFMTANVVCILEDGFATGSYHLLQTVGPSDPFFGNPHTFYEGDVDIVEGTSSTNRTFSTVYLGFDQDMIFDLICGRTVVPTELPTTLACGGADLVWGGTETSGNGAFDAADDSALTIRLEDDLLSSCGLEAVFELSLTKN